MHAEIHGESSKAYGLRCNLQGQKHTYFDISGKLMDQFCNNTWSNLNVTETIKTSAHMV